ncbi:velvet factor-domain-containing protein [Xylariaceae sp. FL1651]|nr:velvet factor-domain-containing protein [Xylariaceae sp. FL1651]
MYRFPNNPEPSNLPAMAPFLNDFSSGMDPRGGYVHSQPCGPYLIVIAYLEYGPGQDHGPDSIPPANLMSGTIVSSLHRLKDPGDQEGAFFVLGDLNVRREGTYCLRFDLLQMEFGVSSDPDSFATVTSITSNPFRVYSQKNFPKQQKNESTFLTRSFSDQGVRLRVRKGPRLSLNRKMNDNVIGRLDRKRLAIDSPGQGRRTQACKQINQIKSKVRFDLI